MENLIWIIWLVIAVVLILAEAFTMGFVLLWFGIGALAAAALAFAGFGFAWQFAAFAVVSVALTAMSRTIVSRYLAGNHEAQAKMGVESLPGRIGTVTEASRGALGEGAVKVYGSTWTAFPLDDTIELKEGEKVEIAYVEGASLYVRPVPKERLGWRSDD